ncbi:MAG TPA: glycosyltransferase family 4 protein [Tepidisphaeraceae bacterium]|nr:glycosyltransferase family 4 protein [Tepidisphaeraceae bacterium]
MYSRIGFVSTMGGVPWAGSECLWHAAAMRLLQQGYQVHANVQEWKPQPSPIGKLKDASAMVTERSLFQGLSGRLRRRLSDPHVWVQTSGCDLVVISQSCLDGVSWGEACRQRDIPYAIIFQVAAEWYWPDEADAEIAREVLSTAKALYFVSSGNRDLIERQLGIALPNAKIVRNPYGVSYKEPFAWPSNDEGLRLACVGRLDARHKGQDLLLTALGDGWFGRNASIVFFGVGSNEAELKRLANLRCRIPVKFAGHVHDIAAIWRIHHAMVLTSRVEGMPLAAVEAMMCGRPCLLTDVAGNSELVRDGVDGFIAEAASVCSVTKTLERLWDQRGQLETMGRQAYARVHTLFPSDPGSAFANDLIGLLEQSPAIRLASEG